MADLKRFIEYHEKKLKEAQKCNNHSAIFHHEQALRFLKKHAGGGVKND